MRITTGILQVFGRSFTTKIGSPGTKTPNWIILCYVMLYAIIILCSVTVNGSTVMSASSTDQLMVASSGWKLFNIIGAADQMSFARLFHHCPLLSGQL
jgi:hypothetical protein